MAEAMIGVALETLWPLIEKELSLFLGVKSEMEKLSSILTTIKAVLEDAEEKQITDKVLKNWLRKLRDEAHLLDYILDECSTYALSLEYQNKVQASCFSSFKPCHVMFRYKMAKKLKAIRQRLDEISEERLKFHLQEAVPEERRNGVMKWRETSSMIPEGHFYGREAEKVKIVDFLVDDASNLEDLSVYPIVGIGGLGKTALAQQVFNDKRVIGHFEPRIWVCVSNDFSLRRLSKAIIESATGKSCEDLELDPLQRRVQELLGRKRYLLVLDDVWNDKMEEWDRLKSVLACGSKGASVLLTTRLANVAHVTKTVNPLHLSLLSEDDCWELFRRQAFWPPNEERAELVDIGKEIVKKCKGVPLAAKTLGSLLCFNSNENYWISIKENEIWNLPMEEQGEGSIMPALRLSYLDLSAKSKQCFAYLAVFPKDKWMRKKQVIELWMANGFISTVKDCDAEDEGDRVWNELYLKSLFEDVSIDDDGLGDKFDKGTRFKMHDLVHDLAEFVMEKECCSMTFNSSPPGERTRHLSIYGGGQFDQQWSSHFSILKSLKSFIILGKDGAITFDVFLKCTSLRALYRKRLEEVPSSIDRLKHLRYLNLSHGDFTTLPDSICRLWNLQTLNLNRCKSLQKLPNQLKCLKSLRHLHLKGCVSLSRLAPEMGELNCLKTLHTYIVGMEKGFFLEEIGNLKLEGTLHIMNLERVTSVMDATKANLANKRLNKLELWWEKEEPSQLQQNEEEILKVLQPHVQLKTLVIRGYDGSQLPQWMMNMLNNLRFLELKDCRNVVDISFLTKLPSLKRLTLSNMDQVVLYRDDERYVDGVERGFQALEYLKLERLPGLVKLSREDGGKMFPCLSRLEVHECPQLNLPFLPFVTSLEVERGLSRVLLDSIKNLPNLEGLHIHSDEELTSFPDDMLGSLKNLKTLYIESLPKLEALSTGLANLNVLGHLSISRCRSLETITEEVLRGLRSLKIFNIGMLRKFKLGAGFRHLTSLQHLSIGGCPGVEDMHDDLQHLTTLSSLNLFGLPNLASLPQWLSNLSSLEELFIVNCPKLTSLPMSIRSLPNLESLMIWNCPELWKRCKDETGADWHKISHVPHRDIQLL